MIQSFTSIVAAEKAKLWQALSRSAVLFALAIFSALAAFGGLVFALLGIYLSLEAVVEPWTAGIIVGCAMIVIAFVALWVIARLITKQGRTPELPPRSSATLAAASPPPGAIPESLRATVSDVLGAAHIRTSDIVIGALVAGLVLGASTNLRQRLVRSITKD
ncbi:putative uncharacterized protein [Methylocaldum marinum]|uniref:Holin-X, holin superfamily III n=1 Tax=Methylocaldum marinum TaxID=1432792 RepID=A0A250KZS1_9GAMM|nr:phage holin family protein [Methylocaldum marinum]BBA37183.1 putative uncharacterized protein [Methylocaldum marinum]